MALSCSIKLVNAIVSAEKRDTPITDVIHTCTLCICCVHVSSEAAHI